MIERPASLRGALLGSVSFGSAHRAEAVFQRPPRLRFPLAARLGSVRITQVVAALKAGRGYEEQLSLGPGWQGWSL